MIYVLRHATLKDAGRLAQIGGGSFLEAYANLLPPQQMLAFCRQHHVESAWHEILTSEAAAWIAEEKDGSMAGYALLGSPQLEDASEGDLELRRIYTLRRTYGTGLGQALLDVAVAEAEKRGARRLLLGVFGKNARALAFYAKHGFTQIGTRVFYVGDLACDDFVLAKTLDQPAAPAA